MPAGVRSPCRNDCAEDRPRPVVSGVKALKEDAMHSTAHLLTVMRQMSKAHARRLKPCLRRTYPVVLLVAAFFLSAPSRLSATTLPSGFAETKMASLHNGTCM